MTDSTQVMLLVSDFNLANLQRILSARMPEIDYQLAPYGNVFQTLHGLGSRPDSALVWTRPERISASFQDLLNFGPPDLGQALAEVDSFADLLLACASQGTQLFVPLWQISFAEFFGPNEMVHSVGLYDVLLQMNAHLSRRLSESSLITLLNSGRWLQAAGPKAWSPKLWYLTKTPFHDEVFLAAQRDLEMHLMHRRGQSIKLIVLDLDDTLWGGTVGEDGWERLVLGGNSAIGESLVDFQKSLKALKNRGILLAIASKNDEKVALEAIQHHPEMILKTEDFVEMRINWNDKAANVKSMAESLNLGLQSILFIDNSAVERARVQEALPEVHVPDWPNNKLLYTEKLRSLGVFNLGVVLAEDLARTESYAQKKQREQAQVAFQDIDSWLQSLNTCVKANRVGEADFARVHQLFGKTNQFNLTTRRPSEDQLKQWLASPDYQLWAFRLDDRFGDAGLIGVLGLQVVDAQTTLITDLLLSCRVMGRKVEQCMTHLASQLAQPQSQILEAVYSPTAKNGPVLEFFQSSGFRPNAEGTAFRWDLSSSYPCPACIELLQN